jgi:hypothetical protein
MKPTPLASSRAPRPTRTATAAPVEARPFPDDPLLDAGLTPPCGTGLVAVVVGVDVPAVVLDVAELDVVEGDVELDADEHVELDADELVD